MTDEKLIEEAAKAIHDVAMREYPGMPADIYGWDVQKDRDRDVYLLEARAAFAVFEKAHAPTPLERVKRSGISEHPCPQPCEHLSQEDSREGRMCPEHPCVCSEPQGEPSDAVVIHALEAYWGPQSTGYWFADQINAMRAALRAATNAGGDDRG